MNKNIKKTDTDIIGSFERDPNDDSIIIY